MVSLKEIWAARGPIDELMHNALTEQTDAILASHLVVAQLALVAAYDHLLDVKPPAEKPSEDEFRRELKKRTRGAWRSHRPQPL
jgi:hypothetical protein